MVQNNQGRRCYIVGRKEGREGGRERGERECETKSGETHAMTVLRGGFIDHERVDRCIVKVAARYV